MKNRKRTIIALAASLALILLGSIFASVFNTSMRSVSVERIKFDALHGELSGLLYMPEDVSAENPKPTIIVTHGYLNSAEMQDANAIELSRRGFVVLALDQYDHGHSKIDPSNYASNDFIGLWLPFWQNSMYDAVQYMYEQPYVLKDAEGNGIIGVTGHSMGGFSATMALALDEQDYAESGIRKIYAGLTEGSDFSYTAMLGIDAATADSLGGGRIMGKVAAQYDEFFFNDPAETGGTVRRKNYVGTPEAQTWLEQEAPEANTWYDTADGGSRIIYQPAQTHPWNHFSKETTGHAVSFYMTAFADYAEMLNDIAPENQIWQWKELFECVALIGFVLMIVPVVMLVTELPFFKQARTAPLPVQPSVTGTGPKVGTFILLFSLILIPALFFTPLIDGGAGSATVNFLFYAGIVFALAGLLGIYYSMKETEHKKAMLTSSILITITSAALAFVARVPQYQNMAFWTAPAVNDIAYWTIVCALISLLALSVIYLVSKAQKGLTFTNYGITFRPVTILASLCTALVTVAVGYGVLFLMDTFFKSDFRIWTFAFKTWDTNILPAVLRYLPTFFLFYLVSSVSITINTNTEKLQGWKGYLLAVALNAGGITLWLLNQYGTLFATGVSVHPESALSGILLVAMVPTLAIAAIFSRALYKRMGNVWTPAFLNAVLMTTMTLANTTVFFK